MYCVQANGVAFRLRYHEGVERAESLGAEKMGFLMQFTHSIPDRKSCDGGPDYHRAGSNPRTPVAIAALTKKVGGRLVW